MLSVLAALAFTAHFFQDRIIAKSKNDAALVNISGRQRMFLQQTHELAGELGRTEDPAIIMRLRKALSSNIEQMEKSHDAMINGDPNMGVDNPMDKRIRTYYFGPDGFLDMEMRKFIMHARNLLKDNKTLYNPDDPEIVYISREASGHLKLSLNKVVGRYQMESKIHLADLHYVETSVLLATIVVLVLSALMVFRPMIGRVKYELDRNERSMESLNHANVTLSERAVKLADANDMLSDFAHVVSHDLKAPLRAVRNYSDFLREDLEGTLDEEQQSYLGGIAQATGEANQLIDDMLDYSRVSSLDTPIETIDVGDFIRKMLETISVTDEIKFSGPCPDGCNMTVEASPVLFKQIVQNLVSNAIKYNNSKNKLIEIGCRLTGDGMGEVFVKDNGIGIDKKYLDKIFDIFQRLHTKGEYNGTGVGLAIVKKAVERVGGTIRVESSPGEGSAFYVSLPVGRPNEG